MRIICFFLHIFSTTALCTTNQKASGYNNIVVGGSYNLINIKKDTQSKGHILNIPRVWKVPPPNFNFVGRKKYLKLVEEKFNKKKEFITVLSGFPGSGKTQIAKQFAHDNHKKYECVWWFYGALSFENQYRLFAQELTKEYEPQLQNIILTADINKVIYVTNNLIRKKNINTLFIFDDVNNLKSLEIYLPFTHNINSHVLITARDKNIISNSIQVDFLSVEEVRRFISKNPVSSKLKRGHVERIINCTKGYPILVALQINFLELKSRAEIENIFNDNSKFFCIINHAQFKYNPLSTTDGYQSDIKNLIMNITNEFKIDPQVYKALNLISIFEEVPLPVNYLIELTKCKNIYETLRIINKYSLLELRYEPGLSIDNKEFIFVHSIIKQEVVSRMPRELYLEYLNEIINFFNEKYDLRSDLSTEKMLDNKNDINLIYEVIRLSEKYKIYSPYLLKLKVTLFDALVGAIRDFVLAEKLLISIKNDLENSISFPDIKTEIVFLTNYGLYTAIINIDLKKSTSLLNESYEKEKKYPIANEERLRILADIIQLCWLENKLEKAQKYIKEGKKLLPLSKSYSYNFLFICACSLILNDEGRFIESCYLFNEYNFERKNLLKYTSILHFVYLQELESNIRAKKIKKSYEILKKVKTSFAKFYKSKGHLQYGNMYMLEALLFLSDTKQTNLKFAESKLESALKIFDRYHGKNKFHRKKAFLFYMMGSISLKKGEEKNAKKYFNLSEKNYSNLRQSKIYDIKILKEKMKQVNL